MTAREKILTAVKQTQPVLQPLPSLESLKPIRYDDKVAQFIKVLETIGGRVVLINDLSDIVDFINHHYSSDKKIITSIESLISIRQLHGVKDAHELDDIDLAILSGVFGIAENGAVWVSEEEMKIRVLPFICQQLAIVIDEKDILHNMHEAYQLIADKKYSFATFIAGPSKTADIEQSLVLGAHGPKEMIIFLMR